MKYTLFILLLLLSSGSIWSSTVVPFKDLGKVTAMADAIYLVESLGEKSELTANGIQKFYNHVQIVEVVKGKKIATLRLPQYRQINGEVTRLISGDFTLDKGKKYLLFLSRDSNNNLRSICLDYYLFEEAKVNDISYLFPLGLKSTGVFVQSNAPFEPPTVYNTNKLLSHLKDVSSSKLAWNASLVKANGSNELLKSRLNKAIPNHCSPLFSQPFARWPYMETAPLPIFYQNNGSGCAQINSEIDNAVAHLNTAYKGIDLQNSGPFSGYEPDCSEGATSISFFGGNFDLFFNKSIGTSRSVLILFDDPCDEITDLSGCSGTLAIGGVYLFNNMYDYNNQTYRVPRYGYVMINEKVGNCYCGTSDQTLSKFGSLLAHELTHALGFGHISSNHGQANMNPVCCKDISELDVSCVDEIYPPMANCSDGLKNGNETGIDCGGGCSPCQVADNCIDELIVNAPLSGDQTFEAKRRISSSSVISNGDIIFNAGKDIWLLPNFKVLLGSNVKAEIAKCE